MRIPLVLSVCIVLLASMVAQADLINVISRDGSTTYSNVLSYTRAHVAGTSLDQINIYCHDIENLGGAQATGLQVLEGTFTITNGSTPNSGMNLTQSDTQWGYAWQKWTDGTVGPTENTDAFMTTSSKGSYVGLPYTVSTDMSWWAETLIGSPYTINYTDGDDNDQTFIGQQSTSLFGDWSSGVGLVDGNATTSRLARLYVSTNAGVSFVGSFNTNKIAGGWGFSNNITTDGNFTIPSIGGGVPEPSTLLLAAGGLVGLLCYAWRKRR